MRKYNTSVVRCKYPRWAINKVQNKVVNGNQGKMVTTMLVTHCKTPMEPAATTKQLLPPGEDPVWDTWSSHMFRA